MVVTPRDARARPEIRGRVALAVVVVSPATDATIASECDGVGSAPRDAGACTEIRGRIALAEVVVSPASDESISPCALFYRNKPRRYEKRGDKPCLRGE